MDTTRLTQQIMAIPLRHKRRLVALAGPPASGKSTLAAGLSSQIPNSCVVPMDGFHLDNDILDFRGLQGRKGAPASFDVHGFHNLLQRLTTEREVFYPTFDRELDKAIAGSGVVENTVETVIVEGNYLLLDAPVWRDMMPLWDSAIYLRVDPFVLRDRLMQRWLDLEYSEEDAEEKVEENDMLNATLVAEKLIPPQFTLDFQ